MKLARDRKGHYRKWMDTVDEELETLRKVVELFRGLQFKESHLWVIRWLKDKYGSK